MSLIHFDQRLLDDIASRFDLREPNRQGLEETVRALSGQESCSQLVLSMATGVGKTYLLAALLDYAAAQGVKNLLVVVPGKTVRAKTINNFTPGAPGYIDGAEIPKTVITPQNFTANAAALRDPDVVKLFLMNIDHLLSKDDSGLIKPGSTKAKSLRTIRPQESIGGSLQEYLRQADDLLMVLDESHEYSESAKVWKPSLDRLYPAARIGLTATPDDGDAVIYEYDLRQAVNDGFVKRPVLALRKGQYPGDIEVGQLKDAKALLDIKAGHYELFEAQHPDAKHVNPIMLVTCRDIDHAERVTESLRHPGMFDGENQVLIVHSKNNDSEVDELLSTVTDPDSPVRAVINVEMLNQGWDVNNVAVLVPLRAMKSTTLAEQTIGRGLRLPYGRVTGNEWVDSLDILSHGKIEQVLKRYSLNEARSVGEPPRSQRDNRVDLSDEERDLDNELRVEATQADEDPRDFDGSAVTAVANMGGSVRSIEDNPSEEERKKPQPVIIRRTQDEDFLFPSSKFTAQTRRATLDDLEPNWETEVAREFGQGVDTSLSRTEIFFTKQGAESGRAQTQAEILDTPLSKDEVEESLCASLRRMPALTNGEGRQANMAQIPHVVHRFVDAVSGDWKMWRLNSATTLLKQKLSAFLSSMSRSGGTSIEIVPIWVPQRHRIILPEGTEVELESQVTAQSFRNRQFYKGWNRNMFEASSFDAYATEMLLARLLDTSPHITRWTRLMPEDNATIEYGLGKSYHPDFLALDTQGANWIIEGKSHDKRDNEEVIDKRNAAARTLRVMSRSSDWDDTTWKYLIAFQDQIKDAESWAQLVATSNPVG